MLGHALKGWQRVKIGARPMVVVGGVPSHTVQASWGAARAPLQAEPAALEPLQFLCYVALFGAD